MRRGTRDGNEILEFAQNFPQAQRKSVLRSFALFLPLSLLSCPTIFGARFFLPTCFYGSCPFSSRAHFWASPRGSGFESPSFPWLKHCSTCSTLSHAHSTLKFRRKIGGNLRGSAAFFAIVPPHSKRPTREMVLQVLKLKFSRSRTNSLAGFRVLDSRPPAWYVPTPSQRSRRRRRMRRPQPERTPGQENQKKNIAPTCLNLNHPPPLQSSHFFAESLIFEAGWLLGSAFSSGSGPFSWEAEEEKEET